MLLMYILLLCWLKNTKHENKNDKIRHFKKYNGKKISLNIWNKQFPKYEN